MLATLLLALLLLLLLLPQLPLKTCFSTQTTPWSSHPRTKRIGVCSAGKLHMHKPASVYSHRSIFLVYALIRLLFPLLCLHSAGTPMASPGKFGQLVVGPPGSGKSTYCAALARHLRALGRPSAVINLDPAAEGTPPYFADEDGGASQGGSGVSMTSLSTTTSRSIERALSTKKLRKGERLGPDMHRILPAQAATFVTSWAAGPPRSTRLS